MFKYSNYNYPLTFDEDVVLMNLVTKNIITITKEKYTLIIENTPDNLKKLNKHLFSALNKLGYIISSNTSEVDIIQYEYNKQIFTDNNYRLTINPTLNCNFKCWYCYEKHNTGVISNEIIDSIKKFVYQRIINDRVSFFNLDWFGGEPMLCFESVIYPLSKYIQNLCKQSNAAFINQITTNGFLIKKDHIEKFKEINLLQFQITLDGDRQNHNEIKKGQNSYDTTVSNIINLVKNIENIDMVVRINYSLENIHTITNIIDDFPLEIRNKIQINFQRIWQHKDLNKIDELNELKKMFVNNGFQIKDFSINFVPTCYADQNNQAVINYDGLVFKCTARDFIKENSDGHLDTYGDIIWNNEKKSKRLGNPRFNNDTCLKCDLLPACYGPCSQKVLETNKDDFEIICNYNGIKETIDYLIRKYYNLNFN